MRFIVIEEQAGDGCDYTIGCGISYSFYQADSPQDAFQQHVAGCDDELEYYGPGGEGELASVQVIWCGEETNEHLWPAFLAARSQENKTKEAAEIEAKERAELERLKTKYKGK